MGGQVQGDKALMGELIRGDIDLMGGPNFDRLYHKPGFSLGRLHMGGWGGTNAGGQIVNGGTHGGIDLMGGT